MECISSVSETVPVADNANSLRKSGNKSYIDKADVTIRHKKKYVAFIRSESVISSVYRRARFRFML
jgi:hypothetical protein